MVLPYADWLASRDRQENLVPNEVVVNLTFDHDWSPMRAWREHLGLTAEVAARANMTQGGRLRPNGEQRQTAPRHPEKDSQGHGNDSRTARFLHCRKYLPRLPEEMLSCSVPAVPFVRYFFFLSSVEVGRVHRQLGMIEWRACFRRA